MDGDVQELQAALRRFAEERDWGQFHTPKNLAASLSIEAAEVLEHFQWRPDARDRDALAGELADVALYLLQLASVSGIDLEQAILDKLRLNHDREWPAP